MNFQVLLCLLFFVTPLFAEQPAPIRFSPIPMLPKEQSIKEFTPFVSYISDQINQKISIELRMFYDDIIDDFIQGKIDLAFLGPLPYVILESRYKDITPMVTFLNSKGKSTYTCSLINFVEDSPSNTDIALTQPYSTCGYLMTEILLQNKNESISDYTHYYIGNHRSAALSVIKGQTRYAGLKTSIAKQFEHLGVNIISTSEALPGFLLVANNKTLSPKAIAQIKEKLLALDPQNHSHQEAMRHWNSIIKNGSISVEDTAYDSVRKRYHEINIPGVTQ